MTNPIIQQLWDLGHFRNPAHMTDVTEARLPTMRLTDAEVRIAIQSYQEFMAADFDRLSNDEHGRKGIADGEIGPATEKLFAVERCGYPDYAIEAAGGSGSWPLGCHPEFPQNHAFKIRVNESGIPSFLAPIFEQVFSKVVAAYADMGIVFFRDDNAARPNTLTTFQNLGGSTIGLAIVPSNPRCGDSIWSRFDPGYRPSDLFNQWCRLLAHEWGHNMGMSHSRGGVMNPSIVSGPFTANAWRGDPSESILKRWFGGVPVNVGGPVDPPPVDPPTGTDGFWFSGGFVLMQGEKPVGEYILIPKPKV